MHENNKVECKICLYEFSCHETLKDHFRRVHKKQQLIESGMILQSKQMSESKNFECSLCGKLFADSHQLEVHYEQTHEKSESNVGDK